MKRTLALAVLALSACSGSSGDGTVTGAGTLAILQADGTVRLLDPSDEAPVTADAGPGRFFSQPTWSPDGSLLAVVASTTANQGRGLEAAGATARVSAQAGPDTAIHLIPVGGGPPEIVETPFAPFYLYWSPDASHLSFLGTDASGDLRLGMLRRSSMQVSLLDRGQPYYYAWSPDSERLLVHRANRDLYFLSRTGDRQVVAESPGGFTAPAWIGDTLMVGWNGESGPTTQLLSPDGTPTVEAVGYSNSIVFGLNPDQVRYAYIDIAPGANPFALGELVVAGVAGSGETTLAELAGAFFWNTDGTRLLYLTPELDEDSFALRWNVWDGTESKSFERFLPTATFVQQYLPFFGQYANSLTFFSPDGSSFTFAGSIEGRGEGVWVQDIASGAPADLVGPGELATWSPKVATGG